MATWNATELATAVLKRLGVLAAGQTAEAEDAKIVTDAWNSVYPQLRHHGIAIWASGAIEEEFQEPLEKYMAAKVYSSFGFSGAREQTILREGLEGWRVLQEMAGADRTTLPINPYYY